MLTSVFKPIAYRGAASTGSSSTIVKPAGVTIGDVVLVAMANDGSSFGDITTVGGSIWSTSNQHMTGTGVYAQLWWKVLDAADVANGWSAPGPGNYRTNAWTGFGATAITLKNTQEIAGSQTLSFTGYIPAQRTSGAIIAVVGFGSSFSSDPSGFSNRDTASPNNGGSLIGYRLDDNPTYAGGSATLTWTASSARQVGWLFEVT